MARAAELQPSSSRAAIVGGAGALVEARTRPGGWGTIDEDGRRGRGPARRRGRPARVGTDGGDNHRRGQEARRCAPRAGHADPARLPEEEEARGDLFFLNPTAAWLTSNGLRSTAETFGRRTGAYKRPSWIQFSVSINLFFPLEELIVW